jgi:hypothetical protein
MPRSLSSLWLTVGVTHKEDPKCLYCGFDFTKAQDALNSAGGEYETVGILPHGIAPVKSRRPQLSAETPKLPEPKPIYTKAKK